VELYYLFLAQGRRWAAYRLSSPRESLPTGSRSRDRLALWCRRGRAEPSRSSLLTGAGKVVDDHLDHLFSPLPCGSEAMQFRGQQLKPVASDGVVKGRDVAGGMSRTTSGGSTGAPGSVITLWSDSWTVMGRCSVACSMAASTCPTRIFVNAVCGASDWLSDGWSVPVLM
jgi:hypothetical protein